MKYVILWSGGLDSTYMIQFLLEEGHKVTAFYVEIANNVEKTKNEKAAIQEIISTNVFDPKKFIYAGDAITSDIKGFHVPRLPQSLVLLNGLAYAADPGRFDKAALGYVMNDCAVSFIPEIKEYWYSMAKLFNNGLPELDFPLIKSDKESMYEYLDKKIKNKIHWCEGPSRYPHSCGKCTPCKRMIKVKPFSFECIPGSI